MSGFFFLSFTVLKLVGYFIPDHGYSVGNSKLNWVKNVQFNMSENQDVSVPIKQASVESFFPHIQFKPGKDGVQNS